ncbi:hypothetical protein D3C79_456560 [compost metagenome]
MRGNGGMSLAEGWQRERKPRASGWPRSIREGAGKEKPPISRMRKPSTSQDEALAFERVGLDPDKGKAWPEGRWNRTTGGASSIWSHSGLVAMGMARACAMARPASPGCPPASGVQRAQAARGVAGGKHPRCPDSFPMDLCRLCSLLHVQSKTVGVALMGDRSPLGKRSGAVAYQAGPVAGMAP